MERLLIVALVSVLTGCVTVEDRPTHMVRSECVGPRIAADPARTPRRADAPAEFKPVTTRKEAMNLMAKGDRMLTREEFVHAFHNLRRGTRISRFRIRQLESQYMRMLEAHLNRKISAEEKRKEEALKKERDKILTIDEATKRLTADEIKR